MTAAQRRRSEPKGKPTARNAHRPGITRANRRATLQWIVVFALIAVLLVGFAILGPSGDGGPTHTRAPIAGHGG